MPRDKIIGSECLKIIFPDASIKEQVFKAMFDDAIKYKRPGNFEGAFTDGSGNEHTICWNITPILRDTKDLEGVLFLGNDITLSKERESSFKNIDDTLKNIFLNIKEYALYVINLEGNITYYGMGSEAMFGWHRNEVIFKHISFLHSYDDIAFRLPFILEQVKNFGRYELEAYFIKKGGQSFPVNLTVTQFIDTNKNINGYIFMAKDITEKRKLEYQIFQSEKLAAVGQLIAGVAHEINNPVFVISGRTEMMLSKKSLSQKMRGDLKIISTQIDKIRKLVDRFLTFTRKTSPNRTEININILIKDTLPFLMYHRLPSYEVKIIKLFAKKMPPIKGDIHQLQEVFVNLFINAYQAMPEGGVLTVKTENLSDEFAQISISDTGCGITTESLKNIFMPFFSTKKEGTGLGLSICYNIIKNHGGTIEVDSQARKGTTFIIKLPFLKIIPGLKR
jgi:PAS domain S-box-containing protein